MRVNTRYINSTTGTSTVTFSWHSCNYKVHKLNQRYIRWNSGMLYVPCIYTHAGDSYRRRLMSLLLCSCCVFRALINSLACRFCTSAERASFHFRFWIDSLFWTKEGARDAVIILRDLELIQAKKETFCS